MCLTGLQLVRNPLSWTGRTQLSQSLGQRYVEELLVPHPLVDSKNFGFLAFDWTEKRMPAINPVSLIYWIH